MSDSHLPVAAQFCATFLKPEMLHIYRQITSLRNFQPVVLTQKRENAERFPFERIITLPKPATRALRRLWQKQILDRPVQIYLSEARRIADVLAQSDAKLLHIYFGHIAVYLLPFIELAKIPVIVSFHGADAMVDMEKPHYRAATQRMLGLASLVLVRSHSLAERLVALGCDRAKLRLHRTGIPLEKFPFHRRETPTDGAWHFLQACRLIPKKGLETSLRAFATFVQTHPVSSFTIAGEGPMLTSLEELAVTLGISGQVRFPGFLSQVDLHSLLTTSHVFLHPSEMGADGNQEGVPNSMLEAMATGLPVLATTHGGIPEAVDSGVSGWLVAEGDDRALARAMEEITSDTVRYCEMGREAAVAVGERFEIQAQVRILEGFYREVL